MTKIDNYLKTIYYYLKVSLLEKDCLVLGLSCGIDSVIVLHFLTSCINSNKLKIYFIDINSQEDKKYLDVIKKHYEKEELIINYIDLTNEYNMLVKSININSKNGLGNIKSKLRSMFLYNIALENNGLVVSTINYSEYFLGHFTKFGDANGDLYPLLGIDKIDIYEIAKYLNIPQEIIKRKPTPGFDCEEYDEEIFGFSYQDLHNYLINNKIDTKIKKNIEENYHKNNHKRRTIKSFLPPLFNTYKG